MASFDLYSVQNTIQRPIIDGTSDLQPGKFLENLVNNLQIKILSLTETEIVFDLIGVDASIANALRRIIMSEVPTIAIESVWIAVNTSIMQDEVLVHRMGLIPIKADPSKLEDLIPGEEETAADTLVFHYDVECPTTVSQVDATSGSFEWLPQGNQEELFGGPDAVRPVHSDILLCPLRPGQRIEVEAHCRRGVGKDHAKYSPVSTVYYRLLPDIILPNPIEGEEAEELKAMCPMQVFDIEDIGGGGGKSKGKKDKGAGSGSGRGRAVVARPRDCTMCRECIRKEGWAERVQLRRRASHYIFTVESSGCLAPELIVQQALQVLREKVQRFRGLAEQAQAGL